jgi:hypothetical protein
MKKSPALYYSFRSLSTVFGLMLIFITGTSSAYAQCSTVSQSNEAWPQHATVYYNLSNITNDGQR